MLKQPRQSDSNIINDAVEIRIRLTGAREKFERPAIRAEAHGERDRPTSPRSSPS